MQVSDELDLICKHSVVNRAHVSGFIRLVAEIMEIIILLSLGIDPKPQFNSHSLNFIPLKGFLSVHLIYY